MYFKYQCHLLLSAIPFARRGVHPTIAQAIALLKRIRIMLGAWQQKNTNTESSSPTHLTTTPPSLSPAAAQLVTATVSR